MKLSLSRIKACRGRACERYINIWTLADFNYWRKNIFLHAAFRRKLKSFGIAELRGIIYVNVYDKTIKEINNIMHNKIERIIKEYFEYLNARLILYKIQRTIRATRNDKIESMRLSINYLYFTMKIIDKRKN